MDLITVLYAYRAIGKCIFFNGKPDIILNKQNCLEKVVNWAE